jgi:hypothetical protein
MLAKYFSAVWVTWEGKMSGIASLCFTLVAVYSTILTGDIGMQHAKGYLWIAAGLFFAFANYKAWQGEHKARIAAETTLADRKT